MTSSVAQAAVPTIPMVAGAVPALNGDIQAAEWKDALVLQAFNLSDSPATEFRVQHDGTSLWVAVDCTEPRAEGSVAHRRGPEDNLSIDDAIEVALGLPGGAGGKLEMGGYEGASGGKVAPMRHMYEFVVNAAGSTSRRYDEAPLPTPRFEAKVSKRKGGWRTEMRIPFESLGVKDPKGLELYANFVRFRFPSNLAWRNMSTWGGYKAFPVDLVRLAATPGKAEPDENESPRKVSARRTGAREAESPVLPVPALEYFPLAHTVIGQVKLQPGGSASLQVAGLSRQAVSPKGGLTRLEVKLPRTLAVGATAVAHLEAKDAAGKVDFSQKKEFTGTPVPEWSGTDAGIKYLKDAVPAPWSVPLVAGRTVKLSHATLDLGDSALPASIKVADGELLARAMEIHLSKGGRRLPVRWATAAVSKNGVRPVVYSKGQFGASTIEVRTEIDYDGFMIVQVRLAGQANAIDRIQFVCPLKSRYARYVAQGSVQSILAVDSGGFRAAGGSRFWLGSETGGLAVASDLTFYQAADRQHEITVRETGAVRELTLTPIDSAAKLKPGTVLQFYLQPTPVRTPSKTTTDDYNLWFEDWSDFQGFPDLAKMPEVKKRAVASHAEGRKQLVYFNQLLAENSPGFAEHREELLAPPERMWYQRAYGISKGVNCYVCCARGPYGDLLLDGIRKLATEGDIDGIYMDGTTVDWDCDNPSHPACDTHRAPVWGEPGVTRIIGTRNFLKRLRGIFDAKGRPLTLAAHTGGGLDIQTLGLTDFSWEGEQLARYLPQYRIPRHEYAIGYSGAPWGYRTLFHDYWLFGRGKNWSLAYALLFNTDTYGGSARGDARPLMRAFDGEGSKFHPYWVDGQKLLSKSKQGRTSVSYYTAPGAVMAVATNFGFLTDEVELKLSGFPHVKEQNWVDVLTGDIYTAKAGLVKVTIPPYHGVALRPQSEAPPPSPPVADALPVVPEITGMNLAQWKVNEEGAGVRRADTAATTGSPATLTIHSVAGGSEAVATLESSGIGGDVEARLKLRQQTGAVVRIEFGPITLTCANGNWTLDGPIDPWNDQRVQQAPWPAGQENDLDIIIRDRKLTVLVNGQALADGMLLSNQPAPTRPFRIATWGGESVTFHLVSLTAKTIRPLESEVVHPVLP